MIRKSAACTCRRLPPENESLARSSGRARPVTPDPASFLPTARELVLQAGRRIMELLKDPLIRARKADRSLVTNADHASNDILRRGLRAAFPAHAILSEETGLEGPADPGFLWLIDPLDGTKAYARGESGFSVMAGLLHRGIPVLGLVYDPLEDHFYESARGNGAFHVHGGRRERVRVSDRADWAAMPLITSTGFPGNLAEALRRAIPIAMLEPVNSVGVKVGYLVRGAADIYVNHHPVHYWDTCGPLAILEEAGGTMTHWDGTPLAYSMDGSYRHPGPTVATNARRHQEVLDVLQRTSGA